MSNEPKVPAVMWPATANPDAAKEQMREEVHELEDSLLADLDAKPTAQDPLAPVAIDPAAERAAYAELLAFLKEHAEEGTEVSVLSEDDFAAETFEPNSTNESNNG